MKWSEEQAAAAERKVQENSSLLVCPEKRGALSVLCPQGGARLLQTAREMGTPGSFVPGLMENSGSERVGEGTS